MVQKLNIPMYGEDIELFSTGSAQDDERLFKFWALFNTCKLVLDKVAALSFAMLNEISFRLEGSHLSNKQICSTLGRDQLSPNFCQN